MPGDYPVDFTRLMTRPFYAGTTELDGHGDHVIDCYPWEDGIDGSATFANRDDAEFYLLARKAFEVLVRRGWTVQQGGGAFGPERNWFVVNVVSGISDWKMHFESLYHGDPFTALVKTDEWYKQHRETPARQ